MPNHPNHPKGPKVPATNPDPSEVIASRQQVQQALNCGITAAQDWCAGKLFTSRRAFQQWETVSGKSKRGMHPAFFDLLKIRISEIK